MSLLAVAENFFSLLRIGSNDVTAYFGLYLLLLFDSDQSEKNCYRPFDG